MTPITKASDNTQKNSISYTACNVASCLIALQKSSHGSHLVSKHDIEFYKNCLKQAQKYSLIVRIFRPFPRLVAFLLEHLFAKGIVTHFALRKRELRRLIENAYQSGIKQCVILGGGFDIGGYRMATLHNDLTIFEIDRPFMHALKIQALQETFETLPSNFIGLPADLALSPLTDILLGTQAFSPEKPTIFVSEGVIMYLSETNVIDLLKQLKLLSAPGSKFLFTAMPPQTEMRRGIRQWTGNICLLLYNEVPGFEIESHKISDFLTQQQFKMITLITQDRLRSEFAKHNAPSVKQSGEYIVMAAIS